MGNTIAGRVQVVQGSPIIHNVESENRAKGKVRAKTVKAGSVESW